MPPKPRPKRPKKPTTPQPLLRTPEDEMGKVEKIKLEANYARGDLKEQFGNVEADDIGGAAEQVAKSHGIYLEYNRAKTGKEKDWMYMVRVSVPGGGSFTREHWRAIDAVADEYTQNPEGEASIRVTTRQNLQFHWVKKQNVPDLVRRIAETGFFTLNGCGDNFRNVMACPLSKFSDIYNANTLAHETAEYFRLPAEAHIEVFEVDMSLIRTPEQHFSYGPRLLNRKFKVAYSAVHRNEQTGELEQDNCVELRTNEIGIAPVLEGEKVVAYMVYIGGGQGEKFGKPTFAGLGKPFGVFTPENLVKGLDSIVSVHQEWGDRKNRHWARMKYVVNEQGIPWFQEQCQARGAEFEQPIDGFDPGPRMLHHGWIRQASNGKWAYGAYIENGRLIDNPRSVADGGWASGHGNGNIKQMTLAMLEKFDGVELMSTPNQDLLFTNIDEAAKDEFEAAMSEYGYGKRNGKAYSTLRVLSGACVGLPTCRLATADSERYEPELIDTLDDMGYGDVEESIGITGCERQCFRPATKTIGWIGQGPERYALKLGGSEDGSTQGQWLSDGENWYLFQTMKDEVPIVVGVLLDWYKANCRNGEKMGSTIRRFGLKAIVEHLKSHPQTSELMNKMRPAPYVPDADSIVEPAQADAVR